MYYYNVKDHIRDEILNLYYNPSTGRNVDPKLEFTKFLTDNYKNKNYSKLLYELNPFLKLKSDYNEKDIVGVIYGKILSKIYEPPLTGGVYYKKYIKYTQKYNMLTKI